MSDVDATTTERVEITMLKSGIGRPSNQRDTLRTLGLKRIGQVVERDLTPAVAGQIRTVRHLVSYRLKGE